MSPQTFPFRMADSTAKNNILGYPENQETTEDRTGRHSLLPRRRGKALPTPGSRCGAALLVAAASFWLAYVMVQCYMALHEGGLSSRSAHGTSPPTLRRLMEGSSACDDDADWRPAAREELELVSLGVADRMLELCQRDDPWQIGCALVRGQKLEPSLWTWNGGALTREQRATTGVESARLQVAEMEALVAGAESLLAAVPLLRLNFDVFRMCFRSRIAMLSQDLYHMGTRYSLRMGKPIDDKWEAESYRCWAAHGRVMKSIRNLTLAVHEVSRQPFSQAPSVPYTTVVAIRDQMREAHMRLLEAISIRDRVFVETTRSLRQAVATARIEDGQWVSESPHHVDAVYHRVVGEAIRLVLDGCTALKVLRSRNELRRELLGVLILGLRQSSKIFNSIPHKTWRFEVLNDQMKRMLRSVVYATLDMYAVYMRKASEGAAFVKNVEEACEAFFNSFDDTKPVDERPAQIMTPQEAVMHANHFVRLRRQIQALCPLVPSAARTIRREIERLSLMADGGPNVLEEHLPLGVPHYDLDSYPVADLADADVGSSVAYASMGAATAFAFSYADAAAGRLRDVAPSITDPAPAAVAHAAPMVDVGYRAFDGLNVAEHFHSIVRGKNDADKSASSSSTAFRSSAKNHNAAAPSRWDSNGMPFGLAPLGAESVWAGTPLEGSEYRHSSEERAGNSAVCVSDRGHESFCGFGNDAGNVGWHEDEENHGSHQASQSVHNAGSSHWGSEADTIAQAALVRQVLSDTPSATACGPVRSDAGNRDDLRLLRWEEHPQPYSEAAEAEHVVQDMMNWPRHSSSSSSSSNNNPLFRPFLCAESSVSGLSSLSYSRHWIGPIDSALTGLSLAMTRYALGAVDQTDSRRQCLFAAASSASTHTATASPEVGTSSGRHALVAGAAQEPQTPSITAGSGLWLGRVVQAVNSTGKTGNPAAALCVTPVSQDAAVHNTDLHDSCSSRGGRSIGSVCGSSSSESRARALYMSLLSDLNSEEPAVEDSTLDILTGLLKDVVYCSSDEDD